MSGDLAYKIVSLRVGGGMSYLPHVRVYCGNCTMQLEFACNSHRPPEMIAKAIRHKGWEFELTNRRAVRCPECLAKQAAARKNQSPNFVEMFGKSVELPPQLLPEDTPLPEPPPPPPPSPKPSPPPVTTADYANYFTPEFKPAPPPASPPPPIQNRLVRKPQVPFATSGKLIREYRIVIKTERQLMEVASVLAGLGEVTALVLTSTEEMPSLVSATVQPERLPAPAPTPTPASPPTSRPNGIDRRKHKTQEHIANMKAAQVARGERHRKKVLKVLDEVRRTHPNGREPRIDEYIHELEIAGLKPLGPYGKWTETNIVKHLGYLQNDTD